jgi:septum formation inhibitor MinC
LPALATQRCISNIQGLRLWRLTMSQAPSVAFAVLDEDSPVGGAVKADRHREHVSLRGTTRGLEILITGTPTTASLGARLAELLAEAPSFFAGSDARVVFEHPLPPGALACLEEVATRFELRIVEINPLVIKRRRTDVPRSLRPEDVPMADLAEGTGPIPDDAASPNGDSWNPAASPTAASPTVASPTAVSPDGESKTAASPAVVSPDADSSKVAAEAALELGGAMPPAPRLVVGPVRSGMIVDHAGHLIVIGDVNPGAEVRAEGSIIVLGRLRGVAHAAIGRDRGFIVALSLQPQQLRIGRMVARAGDADRPSGGAEIAYVSGETIVVERFLGRLPSGLAASM